ncbi:MAG: ABC transporter permease [Micrococcales bacterium]|nr:MAG: ABC transporter permease [Micrococcales bacterium]PIE26103.1 MAG: ABC transporter permease [Micrococcales bacterium]
MAWRTADLVTTAMIGVTFGVAYLLWGYVYHGLEPGTVGFPPIAGVLVGFWFLAGTVAGLVVRRPGAALAAELLAASVEPLLGGSWGAGTLMSGLMQGLGVELAFALFAYRSFRIPVTVLGGVFAGLFESVGWEWWSYWAEWSWTWKLVYAGILAVSGALFAGLGGPALVRALARTGALDAFPPGKQRLRDSAV